MAHRIVASLVVLLLAGGCNRQHQLTNRQIVTAGVVVVGVAALLILAISQCNKGANYCDNAE
jgi:hypothetical protein